MGVRKALKAVVAASAVAASTAIDIAGLYQSDGDVTQHLNIDLDVKAFEDFLKTQDYASAKGIYENGQNSQKGSGLRTLESFSSGLVAKAESLINEDRDLMSEFTLFENYYNDSTWGNTFVYNALDDTSLDDDTRAQLALKGTQYQVVWMYTLREMYESLRNCEIGGDPKPFNWDEGAAFYAGSLVTSAATKFNGKLLLTLAEKRSGAFSTIDGDFADANVEAFNAFNFGLQAVFDEDCDEIRRAINVVRKQMMIPNLQGIIQYAQKSDPALGAATTKEAAEAWAFASAVLPFIDEQNPEAAATIVDNLDVLNVAPQNLVQDGYAAVASAVYSVLPGLCITCEEFGAANFEAEDAAFPAPTCTTGSLPDSCPENFPQFSSSSMVQSSQLLVAACALLFAMFAL